MPNPDHVEWCRHLYAQLADGGCWAIPRSGLMFQKVAAGPLKVLRLVAAMPHVDTMPVTAEELRARQEEDFEATRLHFGEAGIEVQR